MEERSGSTVNKQYVWGNYVDECIQLRTYVTSGAESLPTGSYYPLQDLLYRTKALTNTSGEIVEAYDYDPYGNTLIFSAAGAEDNWWADDATQVDYAVCEVLFCGYRYDAEGKTYQVRNRQYNPTLGRWIQRDPIGFDGGDWNLYGYVRCNPNNSVDAEGLIHPSVIGCLGGGAIGAIGGAISGFRTGNAGCKSLCYGAGGCMLGAIAGLLSPIVATNPFMGSCLSGLMGGVGNALVQPLCNSLCDKCQVQINVKCMFIMTVVDTFVGCLLGAFSDAEKYTSEILFTLGITTTSLGTLCE